MKFFKRAASLVIAAAIACSMLTAFAFNDVETTTNYNEAISLLTSLEVLNGYPDGTFGADKDISREEFVKILYVLVTGSDDAGMYEGVSPFPDVAADRWSAGYINWAKSLGIVVGDPDGNFAPSRNVSFAEAAKMFVVGIGYNASTMTFPYGFIDKGQTLGLFDDLEGVTFYAAAKRGAIAQMGENCLFAEAPRFSVTSGTTTTVYTPAEKVFGIIEGSAVLEATSNYALDADNLTEDGQVLLDGLTFSYNGNVDKLIGSDLAVWYKDKKSDGLTSDDTIINLQAASKNKIYEFGSGAVKSSTTDSKVVFTASGSEISIDYSALDKGISLADGSEVTLNAALFETLSAKSFRIVDQDGDKKADAVYVLEPISAKITFLDAKSGKIMLSSVITSITNMKDSDGNVIVSLYEGAAKSDYVFVTARKSVVDGEIKTVYSVAESQVLEGVALTAMSGSSFWFAGTKMNYIPTVALNTTLNGTVSNTVSGKIPAFAMGNAYDLYLDPNGNIYRAEIAETTKATETMLVTGVSQAADGLGGFSSFTVTGTLSDGTVKTLKLALDDDAIVDGIFSMENGWADENGLYYGEEGFMGSTIAIKHNLIHFGLDKDGEINSLTGIEGLVSGSATVIEGATPAEDAYTDISFVTKQESLKDSDGNRIGYVNEDTTVYIINSGKNTVSVISGDELAAIDGNDHVNMVEGVMSSDKTITTLVLTKASALVSTQSDMVGLVTGITLLPGESSGEVVYELTIVANGKIETYKTDSMSAATAIWTNAAGTKQPLSKAMTNGDVVKDTMMGYVSVELDANGLITGITSLGKDATLSTKGSVTWGQAIVAKDLGGGLALRPIFTLTYNEEPADDKVATVDSSDVALVYADDCVFYTIDASVTDGDLRSADYAAGDVVIIDKDTDISVADVESIMASDDIGTETGIHYFVDYLTEMTSDGEEIVAVFIYTVSL